MDEQNVLTVSMGSIFAVHFSRLPEPDQQKIFDFMRHVQQHGLTNLQGRNKSSDDVPTDDPEWLQKVRYAQQHNLWHYHIGIPCYSPSPHGDCTSEYILHYIRRDKSIRLVDLAAHPPFCLPELENLTENLI